MSAQTLHGWKNQRERSSQALLRLMVWISLTLGRRLSRGVLAGIAAYFLLFAPKARAASGAYLTRALGRAPRWRDRFCHFHSFASTVHDRVYLLNQRFDLFDIEVHGEAELLSELERGPGALLIGAHLGSFEVLRALGKGRAGLRVAMLMYEDNARKINATLDAINPQASRDILPLGRMESMLAARERLDAGDLVGMLADRFLGDHAAVPCRLLDDEVSLPLGPWRAAAMLRRPVFFMAGLYLGGNRYRVHFERIADFTQVPRGQRDAAIQCAAQAYADRLTHHCRQTPYNWFNFFDLWHRP